MSQWEQAGRVQLASSLRVGVVRALGARWRITTARLGRSPITNRVLARGASKGKCWAGSRRCRQLSGTAARSGTVGSEVGGIIITMRSPTAPPPNPSLERTHKGRPRYARSSVFASRGPALVSRSIPTLAVTAPPFAGCLTILFSVATLKNANRV